MFTTTAPRRVPLAARTLHQTPRLNLEVERKFVPTPTSLLLLRTNTCTPPFTKHAYLRTRTIRDVYLDKSNVFLPRGIYVRKRNDGWEMKVAHPTGQGRSEAFTEYTDEGEIRGLVRSTLRCAGHGDTALEELDVVADILARRDEFDIEEFRVVVDETQWGHRVGEVELTREVFAGEQVSAKREMEGAIVAFMRRHGDVFGEGKAVGKLSAYFEWVGRKGGERGGG